jgi:hypothetical protein
MHWCLTDVQLTSDPLSQSAGDDNTVVDTGLLDRDKRHNIRSANAWMRAGVLIKIDQLSRLGDPGKRSGFCSNGAPHIGTTGFRKIGDAFDELGHNDSFWV